jgi:hypothetical protein
VIFGQAGRWPRHSPEDGPELVTDPATDPLQRQTRGRGR